MRRLRRVQLAALVTALVAASCGGAGDGGTKSLGEATARATTTTVPSEAPTSTADVPATRPTVPATTTTVAAQPGTIADPLPMGDEAVSGFVYTDWLGGEWEGYVYGLVAVDRSDYNDDVGQCYLLVGTLVPTVIENGTVSSPFSTPDFSLIADGRLVDSDTLACDTGAADTGGYGWILDAEVTLGTTYPFYAEFFLPGKKPAQIDVVAVGDTGGDEAVYFSPGYLDAIPAPSIGSGTADRYPDALPMGPSSDFRYASWLGDEWDGAVTGLVAVDRSPYGDEPGQCFVLLGMLTPTVIEDGTVSDPFTTPDFAVIAAGHLVDSDSFSCDTTQVESAGYGWILDAEVTEGTEYPFYTAFFMTGKQPAEISVLVAGDAGTNDAMYFEPLYLDTIPTP